jgi:hypothetical protein
MTSAKSTQYLKNKEEISNENSSDSLPKPSNKNFSLKLNSGRPNIEAVNKFLIFLTLFQINFNVLFFQDIPKNIRGKKRKGKCVLLWTT